MFKNYLIIISFGLIVVGLSFVLYQNRQIVSLQEQVFLGNKEIQKANNQLTNLKTELVLSNENITKANQQNAILLQASQNLNLEKLENQKKIETLNREITQKNNEIKANQEEIQKQ